jgi:hypothetical protein
VTPVYIQLFNISAPLTGIELGDNIRFVITGGAPNAPVGVVRNGVGSSQGTTDSSGSWSSFSQSTGDITATAAGSYTDFWAVNGASATPLNADKNYAPFAQPLPTYTVSPNASTGSCPSPSPAGSFTCSDGGATTPSYWGWTPVTYGSKTPYLAAWAGNAASAWTDLNASIGFAPAIGGIGERLDVEIVYDNGTIAASNGLTKSMGQNCFPAPPGCLGFIDQCNGTCFAANSAYESTVYINVPRIQAAVANFNNNSPPNAPAVSLQAYVTTTLAHELGHVLGLGDIFVTDGNNNPLPGVHGICSEVLSVMYSSGSVLTGCGISGPIDPCDPNAIASIYQSHSPGYCSPGVVPQCFYGSQYPCTN